MKIDINKSVAGYENEIWKGFTLKQLLYGGAAVAVASGIILFAYRCCYVPIQAAIYFGIVPGIVVALIGFLKIDDLSLLQYLKEMWRLFECKPLYYESDEEYEERQKLLDTIEAWEKEQDKKKKASERERRKKNRKGKIS